MIHIFRLYGNWKKVKGENGRDKRKVRRESKLSWEEGKIEKEGGEEGGIESGSVIRVDEIKWR